VHEANIRAGRTTRNLILAMIASFERALASGKALVAESGSESNLPV
jgi:hypothetical protein